MSSRGWVKVAASVMVVAGCWSGAGLAAASADRPRAESVCPSAEDADAIDRTPLLDLPDLPPPSLATVRCQTFEAAQWAVLSDNSAGLERLSVAFSQGAGTLAGIERQRRSLSDALASLDERRAPLIGAVGADAATELAGLNRERAALIDQLSALAAQISRDYPDYAQLSAPSALSADDARALMRDDEVLVQIFVNEDATYVWVLNQTSLNWVRVPELGREAMQRRVTDLRRAMVVPEVRGDDGLSAVDADAGPSAFDGTAALALYDLLFGQVRDALGQDNTLLVVAHGPITGIPLGILITEAFDDRPGHEEEQAQMTLASDLRSQFWMADRHLIVNLPTVSSLRAMRCFGAGASRGQRPAACPSVPQGLDESPSSVSPVAFFGVGDPVLMGAASIVGRPAPPPPAPDAIMRGDLADPETLRRLARLPGTALELEAISDTFNQRRPGAAVILTGTDANEPDVRASEALSQARFVSFATHGLLAGQASVGEPGLVLTPPTSASRSNDGFLSASEAARLRLRAEFLVLSACNTAAADGTVGADGLVGLAPAFFYAGAQSILMSHWEVSDDATAELMRLTFQAVTEATDSQDRINRARAFQSAMRDLRQAGAATPGFSIEDSWAHPAYWGAFSFIGAPD